MLGNCGYERRKSEFSQGITDIAHRVFFQRHDVQSRAELGRKRVSSDQLRKRYRSAVPRYFRIK
jgi:hypothetical protein